MKLRLSGVVFLLVIAMLVGLTVLFYKKSFTSVDHVTLQADHIGNQLTVQADVKIRGLVVGEVRKVSSKGNGATIDLAMQPDKMKQIPDNVEAKLLPKTLFGEKYVELDVPTDASGSHLHDGSTIQQAKTSVETEKALDDLLPLLQALKPEQLSTALNALSGALRDRGDALGANFVRAGSYFKKLNPALPTLALDMQGLADFANSTTDATPDLLRVLDNLSASSRNLVQERSSLDTFLSSTTGFAASAQSILAANETKLIALARLSKPSLDLFARYSPEFPCLLKGLAVYDPIVSDTFGGLQPGLHITLEVTKDRGGYAPGQQPKYRDKRNPYCEGLPKPKVPAGDTSFDDGYRTSTTPSSGSFNSSARYLSPTAGTDAVISGVAAPILGVPADKVPSLVTMLFEPLASGASVGLA
ncbi:MAG: mammalian cell entry protein [Frankiales bacterium]|nr:mammalian cell entry protein [Frankiales bacterium]